MTSIVQDPIYGKIIFEENIWSGKKTLTINGVALNREGKNLFVSYEAEEPLNCYLFGSYATGARLVIDNYTVELTARPQWYEVFCSAVIFLLITVWSNSEYLCSIVPMIGGAIGIVISGAIALINFVQMRKQSKVIVKLLIWLGMLLAAFGSCALLAYWVITSLT